MNLRIKSYLPESVFLNAPDKMQSFFGALGHQCLTYLMKILDLPQCLIVSEVMNGNLEKEIK